LIVFIAAQNWRIFQTDVKLTFLNGFLEEEVYVEQSTGYVQTGYEGKILKLKKVFYDIKQAPRAWNNRSYAFFEKMTSSNAHMSMPYIQRRRRMEISYLYICV